MKVGLLASAGWAVAAVLVPKCPACIAGWLALVGIGAGASAAVAPMLRPVALVLAVTTLALVVARRARARRAASASCCSPEGPARASQRGSTIV